MGLAARTNGPGCVELQNADAALRASLARHQDNPDFWSSKTRDRSDSAHCIFQYPAMMVPVVQRRLLAAVIEAQPLAANLWDPFVGSGTSLVSAMHYGLDAYGNDVNPLAVLISRTRTARETDFEIAETAAGVVRDALAAKSLAIETELINIDKWFKPAVALELSRLRRAIRRVGSLWARRFLWVTLAETVRLTSNDRTSTYKLHARPKDEIETRNLSPISVFADLAQQNAKAFAAFRGSLRKADRLEGLIYKGDTAIDLIDTRSLLAETQGVGDGMHLLMTSPPYGDNRTTVPYGQHSYLPLNWIDLHDIGEDVSATALKSTHEIDRRSLGGSPRPTQEALDALYAASGSLKAFAEALPSTPKDAKARLDRFYMDFQASLTAIKARMAPNGYMIWTVGNRNMAGRQVPQDKILAELFEALDCTLVTTLTRTIHHKRMPNRNASSSTMGEERILLLRTATAA